MSRRPGRNHSATFKAKVALTQQRYRSRHRIHGFGFAIPCFLIQFDRLAGVVL